MKRQGSKHKRKSTSPPLQLSSHNPDAIPRGVADQDHPEPAQVSVTSIMKGLKYLMLNHKDVLNLKSVKAVISALEDSKTIQPGESQLEFPNHVHYASSPISAVHKSFRWKQANCDDSSESDIGVGAAYEPLFHSKYSKCGSRTGVFGRSANAPEETALSVKKASVTLSHNFENVYKRVTKHYFFMLKPRRPTRSNLLSVFLSFLAFIFYFQLHTTTGFSRLWLKWENVDLSSVECTIQTPNLAMELLRPPVTCSMCHNISTVHRVSGISPSVFENVYAYSGVPVIVTDAMTNWTAPEAFSFQFFKDIYDKGSRSLKHFGEDCLFFPYATEFRSLKEVFNMSQERSERPWYIGWSNCDAEISHILRQYYQRPYFLPETAESTHADWIFMGTPGFGAQIHIDHVFNPSWQGQIRGHKRWHLQPPPECYYECQSLYADVHPGDIIVLDTNKWYHQTQILPGENSITIGSEYD